MGNSSTKRSTGDPSRTPSQTIQIDCEKDTEGKAKIITALIPSDYRPDLDVKPDNIGITKQFKLKLFDFGVARLINDTEDLTEIPMEYTVSTLLYQPLEVELVEQYDSGVDIWSTGLLVLEFLNCPLHPLTVDSVKKVKIRQRILNVFGLPDDKYKEFFKNRLLSERSRDGMFNDFLTEAFKRLDSSVQDLNEEKRDLLSKMLCINPRRPLASELLDHDYLKAMNSQIKWKKRVQISDNDQVPSHAKNQRDKETLIKMLKSFSRQL